MNDDRHILELGIREDTMLIMGTARIGYLAGPNHSEQDADNVVVTLGNANDEHIFIGAWPSRREAVGEIMSWAHSLIRKLESTDVYDWIAEGERLDESGN
jgi:hypothetical protein